MTKAQKENYEQVVNEAVENQAIPTENPENINIMDGEEPTTAQAESEEHFNIKASDCSIVISEAINKLFIKLFGENKGLKEDDKEEFGDIFAKAADMYGINKEVSGTLGFILSLLIWGAKTTLPKINDEEAMQHLKDQFNNEGEENGKSRDLQPVSFNADGSPANTATN